MKRNTVRKHIAGMFNRMRVSSRYGRKTARLELSTPNVFGATILAQLTSGNLR